MVRPPTARKKRPHLPWVVKPSRAPNTTSIATSGITARTDSTRPRLLLLVTSVTQALKAASLALLPKKVITQSSTITVTAAACTARADPTSFSRPETFTSAKAITLSPHSR